MTGNALTITPLPRPDVPDQFERKPFEEMWKLLESELSSKHDLRSDIIVGQGKELVFENSSGDRSGLRLGSDGSLELIDYSTGVIEQFVVNLSAVNGAAELQTLLEAEDASLAASILTEQQARAAGDAAEALARTTLQAALEAEDVNLDARIIDEIALRIAGDAAEAAARLLLEARVTTAENDLDIVEGDIVAANANISTNQTAIVDLDARKAEASDVTTLFAALETEANELEVFARDGIEWFTNTGAGTPEARRAVPPAGFELITDTDRGHVGRGNQGTVIAVSNAWKIREGQKLEGKIMLRSDGATGAHRTHCRLEILGPNFEYLGVGYGQDVLFNAGATGWAEYDYLSGNISVNDIILAYPSAQYVRPRFHWNITQGGSAYVSGAQTYLDYVILRDVSEREDLQAQVTDEIAARVSGDAAEATARQALEARVTTAEGDIDSAEGSISTVTALANSNTAAIASGDAAQALRSDELQAVFENSVTATKDLAINGDFSILDLTDGKPAGVYPNQDTADRLSMESAPGGGLRILNDANNAVSYAMIAIPVDPNQQYIIRGRHKSEFSTSNGNYIRAMEYDEQLPLGANYITDSTTSESIRRTRPIGLAPENGPMPGPTAVEFEYIYTPTSTAKSMSLALYNWSGHTGWYDVEFVSISSSQAALDQRVTQAEAAITSEAATRASAVSAEAAAREFVRASLTRSGSTSESTFINEDLSMWPEEGSSYPTGWRVWTGGAPTRYTAAGGTEHPEFNHPLSTDNRGFRTDGSGLLIENEMIGEYVARVRVRLVSGGLGGAGLYFFKIRPSDGVGTQGKILPLCDQEDINGVVHGAGAPGQVYEYEIPVTFTAAAGFDSLVFYCMANWSNTGGSVGRQAKHIVFEHASLRRVDTATRELTASVEEHKSVLVGANGVLAVSYGVTLDANGRVSGIYGYNDGQSSSFGISADKIYFGLETYYEDAHNTFVTEDSGYRYRDRGPFGASNDLLLWYGPSSVALNSETMANCIFALDVNGNTSLPLPQFNVTLSGGGGGDRFGSGTATTQGMSAIAKNAPSGALSYAWTCDDPAVSISSPASQTTTFSRHVNVGEAYTANVTCTVTGVNGAEASQTGTVGFAEIS